MTTHFGKVLRSAPGGGAAPGHARIRDADVAEDGSIMILTETPQGAMVRLTPAT